MESFREKPHSLESKEDSLKTCHSCGENKPLGEFSIKSGKKERKIRRERDCKTCKAIQVKEARRLKKIKDLEPKKIPKKSIEPKKLKTKNNLKPVPQFSQKHHSELDFGLWDNLYGRELEDSERIETQSNLMAFVTVLANERNDQQGDYIELSKN